MKSYVYHSATATAHALIEHLIAMMEREPEKTFYFAFSGGSTPSLMFDIWANEYKEVTPWMRMRIYWVMNGVCRQRIMRAIMVPCAVCCWMK